MPFIPFKTGKVQYTTQGAGTPLVVLHGFLESLAIWKPLLPKLTKNHTVIAIDLLGHGQTNCVAEVHTMPLMAEAVYAVLQQEGITKAGFCGHSMGGYVALSFLKMYPEMVSHIMLLNSVASEDTPEKKLNRDRGIKVVQQMPENFIAMGVMNLFSEAHKTEFETEITALKQEALKTPVGGVTAALAGMKVREDSVALLQEATIPKHYIIGDKDPTIDVKTIIAQAEQVGARVTMADGGHMSYMENKALTIQTMLDFFN